MTEKEKLEFLIKALKKLKDELGWLHWDRSSSTRSAIEDKIRWILKAVE